MQAWLKILLLWIAFGGSHILLSSIKLRSGLIARLGEKGFQGLYALVSLVTFIPLVWVYAVNRNMDGLLWNLASIPGFRHAIMLIAVLGLTFACASFFQPSPALMGAPKTEGARGLIRITRHPLFMPLALWALAHALINGFLTDVLFFGGFFLFSLIGCAHQDARKRVTDKHLEPLFAETSLIPFAAILSGRNRLVLSELPWLGLGLGLIISVVIYLLHPWLFHR